MKGFRRHIAEEAARLIANQECSDFFTARRKAAQRFGCSNKRLLPEIGEIDTALREYQRLFKLDTQPKALQYLRQIAVEAMEDLHPFSPRLTGPVLNGTADSNSPIQLYLFVECLEDIVVYFMERHIPYTQGEIKLRYPDGAEKSHPLFDFRAGDASLELIILTPASHSNPPLNSLEGKPDSGATLKQLKSAIGYRSSRGT
ncbi:MAG: hypothetical protein KDI63_11020 [Gammaproteobacteria bacterium]|nr:hypothetical protein [Gammaproteobacteria bacterium]